jgi:hypothetical protein
MSDRNTDRAQKLAEIVRNLADSRDRLDADFASAGAATRLTILTGIAHLQHAIDTLDGTHPLHRKLSVALDTPA